MSATGLEVFDRTLQTTNIWLDEIMAELTWDDRHKAYRALRTVLHALRDHLPVNETAHLSAQLPILIRGAFYEGWKPSATPVRERSLDQFLKHISTAFPFDPEADPQLIATAVFAVLSRNIDSGEAVKVQRVLPEALRNLWP